MEEKHGLQSKSFILKSPYNSRSDDPQNADHYFFAASRRSAGYISAFDLLAAIQAAYYRDWNGNSRGWGPGRCTDIRLNIGSSSLDSTGGRDCGRYYQGDVQACAFLRLNQDDVLLAARIST